MAMALVMRARWRTLVYTKLLGGDTPALVPELQWHAPDPRPALI